MRNAAILQKTNDRGQTHGDAGRVQEVSVFFFGHGHSLEHKHEGTARSADVDGLVRSVQHQDGSEQSMAVSGAMRGRRREQAGGQPGCWSSIVFHAVRHRFKV